MDEPVSIRPNALVTYPFGSRQIRRGASKMDARPEALVVRRGLAGREAKHAVGACVLGFEGQTAQDLRLMSDGSDCQLRLSYVS